MNHLLKEKAVDLRRKGLSYSEILKDIPVAKSTLSLWLREVGLSKRQEQRLTKKKLAAMRRGWLRVNELRIARSEAIKKEAKSEASKLINNPLWLTGAVLYWAEGTKEKKWGPGQPVAFTNMDLAALKIFRMWAVKFLGVLAPDLIYELYIHEGADWKKAKRFWIQNLNLDKNNLRVYFKRPNANPIRKNIDANYFGVLKIRILKSSHLIRKIAGWTEGVIEYFGN